MPSSPLRLSPRIATKVKSAGAMNRLESRYAARLRVLQAAEEILFWQYESIKLRIAAKTFYTPDFLVVNADGVVELHEVKGFWRDDARVKIKVAAEMFPFAFYAATHAGRDWELERIAAR